jgi:UDP-N-acetylmuramoylalanine--D-glutamate ligase
MNLSGRKALVVGLGRSGVAAARLLLSKGADVAAADGNPNVPAPQGVPVLPLDNAAFRGRDLVVVSPGVPLSKIETDAETIGEVELASRFIEAPLVGITGTNGKSTTTALTGHILAAAGRSAFVGGNLGNALSNCVLEGASPDVVVCELSSYQLESIVRLRCAAATVLNVTPDHLDRYPDLDAYARAKARIFENQQPGDLAALNLADARVAAMTTRAGVLRSGFDPRLPAQAQATQAQATQAPFAIPRGAGAQPAAFRSGPRTLSVGGREYALRAPTLRGAHNAENALAALLLCSKIGAGPDELQRGLDSYPGLPHRLEPVRMLAGVEWINDSKATNVDSVEKSLSAFEAGVILLLGGLGKGAPYAPLRPLVQGRVKAILTIGADAARIADELDGTAPVHACGTLPAAVTKARALAKSGDTVLLSPACASYDQFKNFEDRGEQFKQLVEELR